MTTQSVTKRLALLVALVGCAARLAMLDADPKLADWIGYVTDEGRWVETARNLALFGDPGLYELSKLHLALSPGFQIVNYIVFKLTSPSLWSARLFTALSGCGLVLAVYLACRREVSAVALLFGMCLLALEPHLLRISRLALPELPAALFTCLAFLALVFGHHIRWAPLLAGVLAATAVAMKATTVLVVPAFLLVIMVSPPAASVGGRAWRLGMFLAGFGLPVIGGGVLITASGMMDGHALLDVGARLRPFLGLADPYQVLGRYLNNPSAATVNALLLGVWFCSRVWKFHREFRGTALGELYLTSGIWAGWWLLVWSGLAYSPDRYLVHVIVPLSLHVMAGLTLMARIGMDRIVTSIAQGKSSMAVVRAAWLAAPSAVALAPLLIAIGPWAPIDFDRASTRVALVLVTAVVLALLVRRRLNSASVVHSLLYLPVILCALWIGAAALDAIEGFWPAASPGAVLWPLALSVAAIAAAAALARVDPGFASRAVVALVAAVLLGAFTYVTTPDFARPSYSIRSASRALARMFDPHAVISSRAAGTLLLETELRWSEDWPLRQLPDGILVFDHDGRVDTSEPTVAGTRFARSAVFELAINPRYGERGKHPEKPAHGARIVVYEPRR